MAPYLSNNDNDYEYNSNHEYQFHAFKESKFNHKEVAHNATNGKHLGKELIHDALVKRASSINQELCEPGDEDTFFVADLGEIYRQHLRWKLNLGRGKPHYGKLQQLRGLSTLLI